MKILGKILRGIVKQFNSFRSFILLRIYQLMYPGFSFDRSVYLDKGVRIKATDSGEIKLSENVTVERNSTLVAKKGVLVVGPNTFIGEGTIIVANSSIMIGHDCLVAAGVVIRDQDHCTEDLSQPVRLQGLLTGPINIGNDVWIGAKSTILKGVSLGDQCVVGANSVVTRAIPLQSIAVGTPAKVIGSRGDRFEVLHR